MKIKIFNFVLLLFLSMVYLQAQDYLISFAGSGASSTVATVKVENLTQGTSMVMSGSDVLHLKSVITGIEPYVDDSKRGISFLPNPMTDNALIKFDLPENGQTTVTLYDITGRSIIRVRNFLFKGQHTYRMQGIANGLYILKIISDRYSVSGRLICSGSRKDDPIIVYENTVAAQNKESDSKGISSETLMQYNTGDRLKLTGISDIYSTIIVDVPTGSKTITFNFIACTDGDNNNYPIVKIEDQVWMAADLKTTKLNDGIDIQYVPDSLAWAALTTPGYCWYGNNPARKTDYGALYNFFTVNTAKLCPVGWHVPSDPEWTAMTDFLGGETVAGGKLKETGTAHWSNPNTDATNESGFTAVPGGYRNFDGTFNGLTGNVNWRSSTPFDQAFAWYRYIYFYAGNIYRLSGNNEGGFSVRCLKDN